MKVLRSALDRSVQPLKGGSIESRYVRKKDDYIICYVSSSVGCNLGCRQCFLTQQKQNNMFHINPQMFGVQVNHAVSHYLNSDFDGKANRMNVNFMARGDAFTNKHIVNDYENVYDAIENEAKFARLRLKMNISTIMPHTMKHRRLSDVFKSKMQNTFLYYSLYSINDEYRKLWMPNAIDWRLALDKLKEYQNDGGNIITFHWAFIKGQNDRIEDVTALSQKLKEYNFNAKFNLVRYNNPPNLKYVESDNLEELFDIVNSGLNNHSKSYIVPRVGKDVSASCGMFVERDEEE